jgi:hypothetical protein
MEQAIKNFSKALEDLKTLTIADVDDDPLNEEDYFHLTFLCRVNKGSDNIWLEQLKKLLVFCKDQNLNLICSKRYLIKGNGIVFAWCLEFPLNQKIELEKDLNKLSEFLPSLKKLKGVIYNNPTNKPNFNISGGSGEIEILGAPAQRNMTLVTETPVPRELLRGSR